MTGVVWYQRDLRVRDHPALRAALDRRDRVVPVFCFDERLLRGRHASGPRTQFLLECLAELDARFRELGSGLVVRRGRPEQELTALAREIGASAVHFTSDVSPFARRRSESVRRALGAAGVEMVGHAGLTAVDDISEVYTRKGGPYKVFAPFHRNWLDQHRRSVLRAPHALPQLPSQASQRGDCPRSGPWA